MNAAVEVRPLIPESSTSESTTVEVVMNDLKDKIVTIPDYQRDSDQWAEPTKSLLVESIINNLSIPAFFFEVKVESGVEKNDVVDGQQRLTTLFDFYNNKLRLVDSQDAPYLSPNSVHYAGRTYDELPDAYRQAFKKYRLAVIKLRNLNHMRLEVFRRINQGGTPLSGQDIRLAYYGEKSPSLAFIRLVGVYAPEKLAGKRFLENSKEKFGITHPWTSKSALETWRDWWEDKEVARGQTASEMFLWSLITAQVQKLNTILQNDAALQTLNVRFNRAIDEALDAYCAQLSWQDSNSGVPPALMPLDEMRDRFFPWFQRWFDLLIGEKGTSLNVNKHRLVGAVIGAAYAAQVNDGTFTDQQWTDLVEFVRRPAPLAGKYGATWPASKGRWDGDRGYRAQMEAAQKVVSAITNGG
jgi:hypothetical protein